MTATIKKVVNMAKTPPVLYSLVLARIYDIQRNGKPYRSAFEIEPGDPKRPLKQIII